MVGPLLLIVIGVLFLLRNIYPYFGFDKMWPVILIVIGLAKVIEYFQIQPEKREDKKEGE
jgi:hypothetical protein